MIDDQILKKTASHVEHLLKSNDKEGYYFHNYNFFKEKSEEVKSLADQYQISEYYQKPLLLAAWLKDTGRLVDYKNPLSQSLSIADDFLRKNWVEEETIEKVTNLIQSSYKRKADPSLLDRILHDADIAYLGKKSFSRDAELLRVEYESLLNKFIDDYEWEKHKFKLLSDASFLTEAATKKFEKTRARNLKKQREKMEQARVERTQKSNDVVFGRDIETFYRINFRNQFNHNSIIDRKANVMISINTLILAVIVIFSGIGFNFYYKLNDNYRFMAPIIVLLLSSLLSVIFAILAARPRVNGQKLEMENSKANRTSFLNLDNLASISLQDFVLHMRELKNDHQWIYDNMSADLYLLGRNLNDKNRLLHWSYTIFMIGLGISTLLFVFIFSDAITP